MREIIYSLIMIGIEALSCDLFFQTFMQERFERKRWLRGIIVAVLIGAWFSNALYIQNFGLKAMVSVMIMSGLMLVLYKARLSQIFFCAICYLGICQGTDLILLSVVQWFVNETVMDILQKEGKINVLWVLFKLILFLVVIGINRKFSEKNYGLLKDDEWIRFLFFPSFTVAALIFMLVDENIGRKTLFFLSTGLMAANIILFYLIRDFTERAEADRKAGIVREQRNSQLEQYENMERSYHRQKKKVHEFKNHLNCIQGLLQESKEQEALKYISRINNLSEQQMNYFTTLNSVADVIINQKYQQAQEAGISVVTVLNELKGIPMEDKDLVVLLSNLFNNAIEACDKLKKEQRQIKFKFVQKEERVILSIRNPIRGKLRVVNNKIKTTKENRLEHGIGLCNVEEVVEKYKGEGICEADDGVFSYTIIFEKKVMKEVYQSCG